MGPFIVGPALAVVGLGAYLALPRVAAAYFKADADEVAWARARLRERHAIIVPGYVSFGLCCGLIAGSLPAYWPDVVFGLMLLILGIVVPLAALPLLKRRVDSRSSPAAGDFG